MQIVTRLAAVILTAVALIGVTTPGADGAGPRGPRPGPFIAPTSVTYDGATCERVRDDMWLIHARWTVRGGRYAFLGSTQDIQRTGDRVWRGGKRSFVWTVQYFGGRPVQPGQTITTSMPYAYVITPIAKRSRERDVTRYRYPEGEQVVAFTC